MNILVRTSDGLVYARPDTSWNRRSEDYYVPEKFNSIGFAPVVYAHVSHAGKSIRERFAPRYYDALGYGLLLYLHPVSGAAAFAASSCLDGTSLLPELVLPQEGAFRPLPEGNFSVSMEKAAGPTRNLLFDFPSIAEECIHRSIAEASSSCLLRRGDLVCSELSPEKEICRREDSPCRISLSSDNEKLVDFNIIFA